MIVYDPKRTTPNWAPGAADYLEAMLPRDAICFEWGGGQSTLWLANHVPDGFVYTMENSPEWISRTLNLTKHLSNCMLITASKLIPERYVDAVDRVRFPNVYLIDGYLRPECLEKTLGRSRTGDIIVCDDALDYMGDDAYGDVHKFKMPHPNKGEPYGKTFHRQGMHPDTKETWVWRV